MATVIYGPMITGARGSVGGVTFSKGGSQEIAKLKAHVPYPGRSSQHNARIRLARPSNHWAQLTQAQRDDWAAYAITVTLINSLGQSYHPTGQQAYCWFWSTLNRGWTTALDGTAPSLSGAPAVPVCTFAYSATQIQLTGCAPNLGATEMMLVTVFRADKRLKHNRLRLANNVFQLGPWGLPAVLAVGIDTGIASGFLARAHIQWRMIDANRRPSTAQKTYVDWTVS
jgi:hypothetical protein